jgi:hypothetical protein
VDKVQKSNNSDLIPSPGIPISATLHMAQNHHSLPVLNPYMLVDNLFQGRLHVLRKLRNIPRTEAGFCISGRNKEVARELRNKEVLQQGRKFEEEEEIM